MNSIHLLKQKILERNTRLFSPADMSLHSEHNDNLCCIACNTLITSPHFRVVIAGDFTHSFTNPAAITFHIACFSEVENCRTQGLRTPQDTWFPGYHWQIIVCKNCGLQLGWKFSGNDNFFGLIVNRLQISTE